MVDVSNYPTHKQTYEPIATQTLSAAASSVTFSNIPQTFKDLIVNINSKGERTASGDDAILVIFNSDTSTNYSTTRFYYNYIGPSVTSDRLSSDSSSSIGRVNTSYSSNTSMGQCKVSIQSYSNVNVYKTFIGESSANDENYGVATNVGLWRSISSISTITFSCYYGPFSSGSTFSLYGIAG